MKVLIFRPRAFPHLRVPRSLDHSRHTGHDGFRVSASPFRRSSSTPRHPHSERAMTVAVAPALPPHTVPLEQSRKLHTRKPSAFGEILPDGVNPVLKTSTWVVEVRFFLTRRGTHVLIECRWLGDRPSRLKRRGYCFRCEICA